MHSIKLADQQMHFSSAHFVMGANYCEGLHGHNYQVEVELYGPLNSLGMVMDFRDLKKRIIRICKEFDHKILLPGKSESISIHKTDSVVAVTAGEKEYQFPVEDCLLLPIKATTSEILAQYIHASTSIEPEFKLMICVAESSGSKGCYSTV